MQRLLFASALLVIGTFASEASAVQDLPGYDLYRGAGAPSSFYAEGFAGYPGSYGAGMYVAGYGYAGNGYGGFCGPSGCGVRVMQGPCNPWANYQGHNPCGPFHGCGRRARGCNTGCGGNGACGAGAGCGCGGAGHADGSYGEGETIVDGTVTDAVPAPADASLEPTPPAQPAPGTAEPSLGTGT